MKKYYNSLLVITLLVSLVACNNAKDTQATAEIPTATTSTQNTRREETPTKIAEGDYCFKKVENKDVTDIKFRVLSDDDIRGEMIWQPYEKDGAVGTLTGKLSTLR